MKYYPAVTTCRLDTNEPPHLESIDLRLGGFNFLFVGFFKLFSKKNVNKKKEKQTKC